jgi:hypothetical protein
MAIPASLHEIPEKGKLCYHERKAKETISFLVVILLRATGNAPILKQNKFKVTTSHSFLAIQDFVRKQLLLQERDSLVR